MEKEYYFAYGSNMDEKQMAYRCPDAVKVSKGYLYAYRFAIDQAGVATVIPDPRNYVEGIVWSVSKNDIRNLDLYEGVAVNCYRKDYPTVVLNDKAGTSIEPLVYISCRPEWSRPSGTGSPYMRNILKAAARHHFRQDYMQLLAMYAETNTMKPQSRAVKQV